jgi:hypothetical protein
MRVMGGFGAGFESHRYRSGLQPLDSWLGLYLGLRPRLIYIGPLALGLVMGLRWV